MVETVGNASGYRFQFSRLPRSLLRPHIRSFPLPPCPFPLPPSPSLPPFIWPWHRRPWCYPANAPPDFTVGTNGRNRGKCLRSPFPACTPRSLLRSRIRSFPLPHPSLAMASGLDPGVPALPLLTSHLILRFGSLSIDYGQLARQRVGVWVPGVFLLISYLLPEKLMYTNNSYSFPACTTPRNHCCLSIVHLSLAPEP